MRRFLFVSIVMISFSALFLKNIIFLFVIFGILFFLSLKLGEFSLFIKNIEKLSSFCIALFISYVLIAMFKESENIFFIYSLDAVSVILKILIILLFNSIFKKKLDTISKKGIFFKIELITELFSVFEKELFSILGRYKSKIEILRNIDDIAVEFIVKSIMKSFGSDDSAVN